MNLALVQSTSVGGSVNITLSQEEVQPWLSAINDVRNYYTTLPARAARRGGAGPC